MAPLKPRLSCPTSLSSSTVSQKLHCSEPNPILTSPLRSLECPNLCACSCEMRAARGFSLAQNYAVPADYSNRFRCIGSACEDTCCKGWSIPIHLADVYKWTALSPGPLRTLIESSIDLRPRDPVTEGSSPAANSPFAVVRRQTMHCPMLSPDPPLCRIHAQAGPEALPHTCATYPRIVHPEGEAALAFSCPEAARLVLFDPNLLRRTAETSTLPFNADPVRLPDTETGSPEAELRNAFSPSAN